MTAEHDRMGSAADPVEGGNAIEVSTKSRPWFLRATFWQSVIGQALGTVLGGYLAVTIALAQQGLTEFTGWKLVGQTTLVIGVILFGVGVLMIFAVGLGQVTWPLRKRLVDRPGLKLLGAAAVMYDDRVILFKEESISLASNISGIGYIPFEKDKLDAKTNELLRELIGLKILKVSVDD